MTRAIPVLLFLTLPACLNEYHPEYHPETVVSYVQTIKVVEQAPPPPPAPTVVIVMAPEPAPPRAVGRRKMQVVDSSGMGSAFQVAPVSAPAFQAAPVFAADDH